MTKAKFCTGKTVKGKRCKARPLKDTKRCGAHPLSTGLDPVFGSPEQAAAAGKLGGRPRLPAPHERLRELVEQEENLQAVLDTYMSAIKDSVVLAKYEGEVHPSEIPDLAGRVAAAELLLSRVYGKPKQIVEDVSETPAALVQIVTGDDHEISDAAREFLRSLLPS